MTIAFEKFSLRPAMKLVLPKEHGSWSLALEPLALGILVAPSGPGLALGVAATAGFFLRRPLKLAWSGKADPRRPLALECVAVLAALTLLALTCALKSAEWTRLWPLIPALLAGGVFAWFDLRNEGREGAAELFGTVAFGCLPATVAELAGWRWLPALALAAVMLSRSVPTVLLVRTYLRRRKGQSVNREPAVIASLLAAILMASLVGFGLVPGVVVIFAMLLALRTVLLLGLRPRLTARVVGIAEAVIGVVMILTVAAAWKFS